MDSANSKAFRFLTNFAKLSMEKYEDNLQHAVLWQEFYTRISYTWANECNYISTLSSHKRVKYPAWSGLQRYQMSTHTHIGATEMHGIQSKRIEHQWEFRGPRKLLPHGQKVECGMVNVEERGDTTRERSRSQCLRTWTNLHNDREPACQRVFSFPSSPRHCSALPSILVRNTPARLNDASGTNDWQSVAWGCCHSIQAQQLLQ